MQLIPGEFQWALLIFGIWLIIQSVSMVISHIIALVYDPVEPCCFNSQVNIYNNNNNNLILILRAFREMIKGA